MLCKSEKPFIIIILYYYVNCINTVCAMYMRVSMCVCALSGSQHPELLMWLSYRMLTRTISLQRCPLNHTGSRQAWDSFLNTFWCSDKSKYRIFADQFWRRVNPSRHALRSEWPFIIIIIIIKSHVFVAGWRHALRSEWPFIIIIKSHGVG